MWMATLSPENNFNKNTCIAWLKTYGPFFRCAHKHHIFLCMTASSLPLPFGDFSKLHFWAHSTCQLLLCWWRIGEVAVGGGASTGGKYWTSCWILSVPACARSASQFISQPLLFCTLLGQVSQQVSLCRGAGPLLCAQNKMGYRAAALQCFFLII